MPLVFLVPALLAGLIAIGVPLVLHLRRRERERPQRFPSLMFLQRVTVTTARRRRITDWPLLLLRAAIVALLVFAFARPVLRPHAGAGTPHGSRRVIVALDKSMSMGHLAVWHAAQDSARDMIRALSAGDRVAVIAFDDDATVEQPLTADHALAVSAVARIHPSSRGTRYSAAIRAAGELLEKEVGISGGDVLVVTDLQRSGAQGAAGLSLPPMVTLRAVNAAPALHGNAAIIGVDVHRLLSADTGRARLAVSAQLVAHGLAAPRRTRVTLAVNGRDAGSSDVMLPADGTVTATFNDVSLPIGAVRLTVTRPADSLRADDVFNVVVPPQLVRRVILVTAPGLPADATLYLERALTTGNDPALRIERRAPGSLNASVLRDALAVILFGAPVPGGAPATALAAYVHDGGGLIQVAEPGTVLPRAAATLMPASTNGMIDRTADGGGALEVTALEHPVFSAFRGASAGSLASAHFYRYVRMNPSNDAQVLARFDDGAPALAERREGSGHVLLAAMPLDATSSDFPLQPGYLPLVRSLVLYAGGALHTDLWYTAGDPWIVPAAVHDPVVRTPGGQVFRPDPVHGVRIITLDESGYYTIFDGRAAGDPLAILAVNSAAAESDLTPMRATDLLVGVRQDSLRPSVLATVTLVDAERRQRLWRILLVLAAVALAGETWMASHGWRGTAARVPGTATERTMG